MTEAEAYEAICYHTLSLGDADFIHQHVVDAFAAQDAREDDKPIRLTFALIGLYLYVEKGLTGREVQRAHMTIAKRKREWPRFQLPSDRGAVTAIDVERAKPGQERRQMIRQWCECVWERFKTESPIIERLLSDAGVNPLR
jgi:hypothetical protein